VVNYNGKKIKESYGDEEVNQIYLGF